MIHKIQLLLNEKPGKNPEEKISRRKLIAVSFSIALSVIGLKIKSVEQLPQPNATNAYGSGAYGG
jgi:hypothetical protein